MLRKHKGQRGSIPGTFSAEVDSADSPENNGRGVSTAVPSAKVVATSAGCCHVISILSIPTSKCMSTAISLCSLPSTDEEMLA